MADRGHVRYTDVPFLEMRGMVKRFSGVVASDHIDLKVEKGEVHCLLGENGAGKTVLMKLLYGLYRADRGQIFLGGKEVTINSPRDAIELGIGMVHQHFTLVPPLTVADNLILGMIPSYGLIHKKEVEQKINELSKRYGLKVNPRAQTWQLSVGDQQRVEILKALFRGAELLILDEPTAVLTSMEVDQLFATIQLLTKDAGKAVIFITHKLNETMAISDRVTVLRDGKVVTTVETSKTNPRELAKWMVGREVLFRLEKTPFKPGEVVLEVKGLTTLDDLGLTKVKGVSFEVRQREIFGIAGVAGNGQRELVEAITGLRKVIKGNVIVNRADVTNRSVGDIMKHGVGHVPEDRYKHGLVVQLPLYENCILDNYSNPEFLNRWKLYDKRTIYDYANRIAKEYDVVMPSIEIETEVLSGGNLQKLILARELSRSPSLLIVNQPTRGVDVGATEFVHRKLLEQRDAGRAILLISAELEEILSLSDRIAVIYEGEIVGLHDSENANMHQIASEMGGFRKQ